MAKEEKKKRRKSRGGGIGGGRWGIDTTETGLSVVAASVGQAVKDWIDTPESRWPGFIKNAEPADLGLYGLGCIFNKRSLRSVGVGLLLGRSVFTALT